ncbi:MAG TPA: ABC transporter ATP-binding protein [Acidimicrobiales bacterium]|nr:ABC transporter ATP-binding protein [Acidimicrobiales bacterium]
MTADVDGQAILEARNITKVFEVKRTRVAALYDVSLSVRRGEFLSLVGPSGCGKTTLLRILDNLTTPDAGEVLFEGEPLRTSSRDMAFVFQETALLPWRSVCRNVELGLEARGITGKEARAAAMEVLRLVGLGSVSEQPPYTLSGGMQQRVGIARALVTQPKVLLMDEPFSHLDNFTREALQVELQRLWSQFRMTTVFVTHDIDEAIFLSDRIALFRSHPGRIVDIADVPLERPRTQSQVRADPTAIKLRELIVEELGVQAAEDAAAASPKA